MELRACKTNEIGRCFRAAPDPFLFLKFDHAKLIDHVLRPLFLVNYIAMVIRKNPERDFISVLGERGLNA